MKTKIARDNQEVRILTYCHKCHKVFTGSQTCCPKCKVDESMRFIAEHSIKSWIEIERAYDKILDRQCGCCDEIIKQCEA
jgi:uncharacterized OB-fold protein